MYLFVSLVVAVACGFIAKSISANRGMEGGFWWGFWLGIFGVAYVALRSKH